MSNHIELGMEGKRGMSSIILLSVLMLSGCTSHVDRLNQEHEDIKRDMKISNLQDEINRMIVIVEKNDYIIKELMKKVRELENPEARGPRLIKPSDI